VEEESPGMLKKDPLYFRTSDTINFSGRRARSWKRR
jgi:hypothetical protein